MLFAPSLQVFLKLKPEINELYLTWASYNVLEELLYIFEKNQQGTQSGNG